MTKAQEVCSALESLFDAARQQFGSGFEERNYLTVCHGCGQFHAVRASFLSLPMSLGFAFADGSTLSVPCHKCSDCPNEAIKAAWENGVSPATRQRADEYIRQFVA